MVATAPSTILLQDGPLRVAHHVCPPDDARWHAENRVVTGHLVVFPWAPVGMRPAGGDLMTADPNCILFWNHGEVFRRERVDDRGDESAVLALDGSLAAEIVAEFEPEARDRPDRPFSIRRGPCDGTAFLAQAAIVHAALSGTQTDPVEWQEAAMLLVERAVRAAYRAPAPRPTPGPRRIVQTEAMEQTRAFLARNWSRPLTLADISARIGFSPFHLCRIFRQSTGLSLHGYLTQLRVRGALEAIARGPDRLADIARNCGFANHSHLTRGFRAVFGLTPSQARRIIRDGRMADLAACLSPEVTGRD